MGKSLPFWEGMSIHSEHPLSTDRSANGPYLPWPGRALSPRAPSDIRTYALSLWQELPHVPFHGPFGTSTDSARARRSLPAYPARNIWPIFLPSRHDAQSIAAARRPMAQTPSAAATFTPFSSPSINVYMAFVIG